MDKQQFRAIFCTLTFGAFCALAMYSWTQHEAIEAYKAGNLTWYQKPVGNDDTKSDLNQQ